GVGAPCVASSSPVGSPRMFDRKDLAYEFEALAPASSPAKDQASVNAHAASAAATPTRGRKRGASSTATVSARMTSSTIFAPVGVRNANDVRLNHSSSAKPGDCE